MSRTTPPRPVDVARVFPELVPLARETTRLHPRVGRPGVHESSIGGPLLWPADEPWPTCDAVHENSPLRTDPSRVADVRERRRILAAAWARPRARGADLLTAEERLVLDRADALPAPEIPLAPIPLMPVAQLYARDTPALVGPPGADLVQVLWCPFDHENYQPEVRLTWRRAEEVTDVSTDPPEPAVVQDADWVLEPCVVHPEVVTEYPAPHELPADSAGLVAAWDEQQDELESELLYQFDLGVAPGWKLGGWGPWSFTDPAPLDCACGAPMRPFLTIASYEWQGLGGSWQPFEDRVDLSLPFPRSLPDGSVSTNTPTEVYIGRGYNLQVYTCPSSIDHPVRQRMQ
jgi:hypothetical protein